MVSIKQSLYLGAVWNSISQFGSQVINLLVFVFLAKHVEPSEFGIFTSIHVLVAFVALFVEYGLTATIVLKKEIDRRDEGVVFLATLVLSVALLALLCLLAPFFSSYYLKGEYTGHIIATSSVLIFMQIAFVAEALERRQLRYSLISKSELIATSISGLLAVVLAIKGFGLWALVLQGVSYRATRSLSLIILARWRPTFSMQLDRLKAVFSLGSRFTVANILQYLQENADYIIIGKFLGPAALGVYSLAYRLTKYPMQRIWMIFGQMLLPAFNRFADDRDRVVKNLYAVTRVGILAIFPVLGFVILGARDFIPYVLGDKWADASAIVIVLTFFIVAQGATLAFESLLLCRGQISWLNKWKSLSILAFCIVATVFVDTLGVVGVAAIYSAASIAYSLLMVHKVTSLLHIPLRDFLSIIAAPVGVSLVPLLSTLAMRSLIDSAVLLIALYLFQVFLLTLAYLCWAKVIQFKPVRLRMDLI